MNGCPLDLAFNTQSINIDKKKEKTKNIVYPNEIKDYHSANIMTNNELRSANEFVESENKFVTTKSDYSKLTHYDTPVKYSQVNDNKDDNFVKLVMKNIKNIKNINKKDSIQIMKIMKIMKIIILVLLMIILMIRFYLDYMVFYFILNR